MSENSRAFDSLNSCPNLDKAALCAMKRCKQYMRWNYYFKFQQGEDNSLNSWPNLDEAAQSAMKRCKAP